jgi:glyoxylase-like metal-dependent hydrolase (beta-lactamase superfamily II)
MYRAQVEAGSTVVVFGLGMVGLGAVAGARLMGAERIIAVDLAEERLELARRHGATDGWLGGEGVVERVLEETGGFGADFTFEATGNVGVMRQAVEAARMGWGVACMTGVAGKGETLDVVPRLLITGRKVMGASFGGREGARAGPPARRPLPRGRHRRRLVRVTPADARRRQPGLRPHAPPGRNPQCDRVRGMILERTEAPGWTSNAYLLADREGGHAVLVDANGVLEPLIEKVGRLGLTVDAIVLTHHHGDHVEGLADYRERFPDAPVYAHPWTRDELAPAVAVDRTLDEGDVLEAGDLRIEALHTPGHAAGHLALLVDGTDVLTADVLFKGTVGGSFAPGNTGYADLKASVLRLVGLPPETRVHPGHTQPTTVGAERESNPSCASGRARSGGRRARDGVGPRGDPRALGPRLRRHEQSLGPLSRHGRGRHRRRLAGQALRGLGVG